MRYFALLSFLACVAYAVEPLAESARAKVAQIKQDKAVRGSSVLLSAQELNAWVRAELADEPGLGMRESKVTLGAGSVGFEAIADFGKLAGKNDPNGLLARMLAGDRQIKMVLRPETAAGKLTVHLERAEISGMVLTGSVLNLAAKLVLSTLYDDVEIDQPVEMGHNIDHAIVDPSGIRIFITPAQAAKPAAR